MGIILGPVYIVFLVVVFYYFCKSLSSFFEDRKFKEISIFEKIAFPFLSFFISIPIVLYQYYSNKNSSLYIFNFYFYPLLPIILMILLSYVTSRSKIDFFRIFTNSLRFGSFFVIPISICVHTYIFPTLNIKTFH